LTNAYHTTLIGPTRSGKGAGIIIPTLKTNPETFIVIDSKDGENYAKTASFRAKEFGHDIIALDPFRLGTDSPNTMNPLDVINPESLESLSQIHALAEACIEKDPNAKDRHWEKRAVMHLKGAIATVVYFFPPEERNLQQVANLMASKELLEDAKNRLKQSDLHKGLLKRLGNEMSQPTGKELDGILSTAGTSLAFLGDPAIFESTLTSNFNIGDLNNKSIFLIQPLKYIRSHVGIMRLWTTAYMQAVINRGLNGNPVNMILDEVAALGPMPIFKDMITIGAGYGLKSMFVFQSIGQLQTVFPEDKGQTLMANSSHVYLKIQDKETSEHVSSMLGKHTLVIENGSTTVGETGQSDPHGKGGGSSWSRSQSRSTQQTGREMARPEEVRSWNDTVIVFHPGVSHPIATTLARYYDSFRNPKPMGAFRMTVDTLCLFITSAALAALWTYGLYHHWFEEFKR
jgi:type IV secretion system protein VirD4